ncbi:MAG TPA: Hpt domain-containing protein [Usitatibacteraceae bacterium]|nr:Hpt domain-containing protein [Usitatibacteraceae bacterium]
MTDPKPDKVPLDISDEVRELAGLFLRERHADLARLDAALADDDYATIRAVGHAFRGSSAPFGFPEAGRIGAELEKAAERHDRAAVDALVPRLRAAIPQAGPGEP